MAITKVDDRGLNTPVDLLDNEKIRFGTGNDFEIYYNGSYSFVESTAGALILRGAGGSDWIHIEPKTDENGILIKPDGAVEAYYDNVKRFETTSAGISIVGTIEASGNLDLPDWGQVKLGTGDDLLIYHNGTNSFITNTTGYLDITNSASYSYFDTNSLYIRSGDASEDLAKFLHNGACKLYYDNSEKLETTSTGVSITGNCVITGHFYGPDNSELRLGSTDDLKLYHDGTNSYIKDTGTGNLIIDGSDNVELRAGGSTKAYTYANGLFIYNAQIPDDGVLNIGNGSDLKIYHDGSHSYIKDVGTGELRLSTSQFTVQNAAGDETLLYAVDGGAVGLKYADSLKLATTSTGVQINGNDFKYPSGYGLFMAYKSTNSQTLSHNTQTVIQYDTEDRDQQGWYDTSTYKYTPQVAGWYQIFASSYGYNFATQGVEYQTKILKNGTNIAYSHNGHDNYGGGASTNISSIVYLNGSSDYVQGAAYQYNSAASNDNIHGGTIRNTCFYGYLLDAT